MEAIGSSFWIRPSARSVARLGESCWAQGPPMHCRAAAGNVESPRMPATATRRRGAIAITDYRCTARPGDIPFVEAHRGFDVAYVRAGSFGYRGRAGSFELVAGSILLGHPGDEF